VTTYTEEKYWKIFERFLPKEGDTKNIPKPKTINVNMNIYVG